MAESTVGYNIAVGVEEETGDYGVDPGASRTWFEYMNESVEEERDTMEHRTTRGRPNEESDNQGRVSVSGSFDVFVNAENIGYLLKLILGTAAAPTQPDATNAPNTYEHTLSIDELSVNSFVYETDYGRPQDSTNNKAKIATGCRLSSLTLDIGDEFVSATANLAGQDLDPDVDATAVTFTEWPRSFNFKDFELYVMDNGDAIGGSSSNEISIDIASGSITMESDNLEDDYRQGQQVIESLPTGPLSISMDFDIVYHADASSDVKNFLAGDDVDKQVVVRWVGDNIENTYDFEMKFTMQHCYCESGDPVVSGPGERVERSVTIESMYDFADASGTEVLLRNEKDSAY